MATAAPATLSELLRTPGLVESSCLRSRFGFMAIHGGGLERMTDVIADRAAAACGASLYVVRHPPGYRHHLTSRLFRAEESALLAAFLQHVEVVVSLHGYGRPARRRQLLVGGRNRSLAEHVASCVGLPGYRAVTDLASIPRELRGLHPDNPVNLPRLAGAQLELPPRVRGLGLFRPEPGPDRIPPTVRALIDGLADAARRWPARREGLREGRQQGA
ncbi:hypothetical protein HMPREF9336_02404 [Segniliparus rugosus ATCC BAA-974]|uniref:Replication protein n=1 Tax=Segniliparus rugosus (strain ATCC BAA-974 / DSM 45345 / CCUG 50838 / CIP 108380 / JCM 13579 / CDC 945) TaxID=679197 RepID=E5XSD2_SEGRC|nr:hypothetical protein HMPREF9336_02404 [Segniliparus rugosus ATCC BAA-974]